MKRPLSGLVAVLLCGCQIALAGSGWAEFLDRPDSAQLGRLAQGLTAAARPCDPAAMPDRAQTARLLRLVDGGSRFAAHAAVLIGKCVGVAPAEDLYRSLGIFGERYATQLLDIAREEAVPDRNLQYLFVMLPAALTDDIDGQIAAIDRRLRAVRGVTDASVAHLRDAALKALEEQKNTLVEAKADLSK